MICHNGQVTCIFTNAGSTSRGGPEGKPGGCIVVGSFLGNWAWCSIVAGVNDEQRKLVWLLAWNGWIIQSSNMDDVEYCIVLYINALCQVAGFCRSSALRYWKQRCHNRRDDRLKGKYCTHVHTLSPSEHGLIFSESGGGNDLVLWC